jgi:hypothetical protein
LTLRIFYPKKGGEPREKVRFAAAGIRPGKKSAFPDGYPSQKGLAPQAI